MDSMLDGPKSDESEAIENDNDELRAVVVTDVEVKMEPDETKEVPHPVDQPRPEPRELEEGEEDEYDPSKPFVAPFAGAKPLSSSNPGPPTGAVPPPRSFFPPPPPTLPGSFVPPPFMGRPPPPPNFPNFAPTLPLPNHPMGSASPLPFPFLPGGPPPPPPTLRVPPPPTLAIPPPPTLKLPIPVPSPISFPSTAPTMTSATAESEFTPIPGSSYGQQHTGGTSRDQRGKRNRHRNRQKASYSANIQDNLRTALYQDEKYTLHEPVWKVVAGQMTRVHYIETSPTDLPITKLIATKKTDAVAMHKRLLEKSTAAIYYSDGSFKHGWAWGAAVEWVKAAPDGSEARIGKKLREELGMCDPTDAEMGGMRKALEAFASVGKLKEQELIIFSDSQAAITLIDSGIRYQSQLFISTLERTLTLHPNVKVSIIWIPGHVGITGNELADRTAVEGLTTTFLARRAGRLPGVPDQEGSMPVILSRKKGEDGEEPAESSSSGGPGTAGAKLEAPTDDSLIAQAGSLFIASFPAAATANDLEVLFGQFGRLTSIDMFTIPPMTERFALLSFADASNSDEAIEWLDEKPVTLPSRYAAERDCEVWKGWQGSLVVAKNQVGRLVPERIVHLFPGLPAWSKGEEDPDEIKESTMSPETGPHLALDGEEDRPSYPSSDLKRKFSFTDDAIRPPKPSKFPFQPMPSTSTSPGGKTLKELTPSEKFLLTHESFPKGPGNRHAKGFERGVSPSGSSTSVSGAARAAPYPPPGKSGRPPLPPQNSLFALPPPKPIEPPPQPKPSIPPPPPHLVDPAGLPLPSILGEPIPTSIAGMARLIIDLKSLAALLNTQHARLSVVARDPADWSLAIAHLTKMMMNEQEILEAARRDRAKAEDGVKEWEGVLQRNDVGIEERRGFVLDVLDMLDEAVLGQKQVILTLRSQIELDLTSLQERMADLPTTTVSVLQSSEEILSTLHHALEEQRTALEEADRRSSVLAGLVNVRRNARGMWRDRQEELDIVVRSLTADSAANLSSAALPSRAALASPPRGNRETSRTRSTVADTKMARSVSVSSNSRRRSPSPSASMRSPTNLGSSSVDDYIPPYINNGSKHANGNDASSMPAPSSFPPRPQHFPDFPPNFNGGSNPLHHSLPPPPQSFQPSSPLRDQHPPPPPPSSFQPPPVPAPGFYSKGALPSTARIPQNPREQAQGYAKGSGGGWMGPGSGDGGGGHSGGHGYNRNNGEGGDQRGGRDPRWGNQGGSGTNRYGNGDGRRDSRDGGSYGGDGYRGHGY